MEQRLAVATEAAIKAGRFLRDHIDGSREISYKGEINLVTEMDRHSEQIIVTALRRAFPGDQIVAEEETRIENSSEFKWIVDPLDGTTNYAHGYPSFSVSIGLERAGELFLGVVFDPMRNELFSALKRSGAQLNGKRIHVSDTGTLIQSLLATGFPYDRLTSKENNVNYFHAFLMVSQEIRRSGSAALDLCSVAAGRLDGYWELKLQPWDVAAGSLIVAEAGGTVSDFSGSRFSIYHKQILATNGIIHSSMVEILRKSAQ